MEKTLGNFIRALRTAEVRVSTAETLDAFNAVQLVGYRDREFLKNTLSMVLPKTSEEKDAFDTCFEQYFTFEEFEDSEASAAEGQEAGEGGERQELGDESDAEGADGGGTPGGAGGTGGRRKPKKLETEQVAGQENLGTGPMPEPATSLGKLLMRGDRIELTMAMAEAAKDVKLEEISVFTQKGLYTRKIMDAMGLKEMNQEVSGLSQSFQLPERRLAQELKRRREWLREQVRDYVERQFLLHADATGRKLREDLLKKVKLSNIEHRNFHHIQEIVLRMAKRLVALHSRKKKVFKRGQLNVPRTIRYNMAYDGALFDLHWKSVKIDRPKVFAICDVSGSVANYVRFMLMLLYSLQEVMPKLRAFAFSSDLGEVTDLFEHADIEDAISKTIRDYSGGVTDYGQSFLDFRKKCMDDVDNRTTIIILGDGRNNYGEPHAEILKEMYDRCKRLIWLNPEPRNTWNVGDSEMKKYAAYSHVVEECNSLMHMERVVSNLLRTVN